MFFECNENVIENSVDSKEWNDSPVIIAYAVAPLVLLPLTALIGFNCLNSVSCTFSVHWII